MVGLSILDLDAVRAAPVARVPHTSLGSGGLSVLGRRPCQGERRVAQRARIEDAAERGRDHRAPFLKGICGR